MARSPRRARPGTSGDAPAGAAGLARQPAGDGPAGGSGPRARPVVQRPVDEQGFVGRAAELAALAGAVASGARVVTLLGPGGIGKTRLARRFAAGWAPRGAARFCPVAGARTEADVIAALAAALEVPLGDADPRAGPVATAARALAALGPAVVVLDEAEQPAAAVAAVLPGLAELAPQACFVVTSRRRLGLPHETCVPVGPLAVDEGVALYRLGARRRLGPGYDPGEEAVAELVRRLDGLPLAIELAAARAAVLPVPRLLERLDARLDLLHDPGAPAGPHASLRRTLDASWELLDAGERAALEQSSTFRGAFDTELAERVLRLPPGAPPVVDALASLLDRSLLALDGSGGSFRLLESIRLFASERLATAGDGEAARARHAAAVVERAERLLETLQGPTAARGLQGLAELGDDLLAVTAGTADGAAVRAALCLDPLLAIRGPVVRHEELLQAAHARAGTLPAATRARVELAAARLDRLRGRLDGARVRLGSVRGLASGAPAEAAEAALALGALELEAGALEAAGALLTEAERLATAAGDRRIPGLALLERARIEHLRGRPDDARLALERALASLSGAGDAPATCLALRQLGNLQREQGRWEAAAVTLDRALDLARALGDRRREGDLLGLRATVHAERGELAGAGELLRRAHELQRELGDVRLQAVTLGNLGRVAHEDDRPAEAEELLQAARALHGQAGNRRGEAFVLFSLALLAHEQGRRAAAAAWLDACRAAAVEAGDVRLDALARAHRAALRAELGDPAAGREELGDAGRALDTLAAPNLAGVVPVLAALVELAAGGAEAVTGARRALDDATRPATGAGGSPAQRSSNVRMAARLLSHALARIAPGAQPASGPALELGPGAAWLQPPGGTRVSLARRHALRRLLQRLAEHRLAAPGRGLSQHELLEAGWPGERVLPDAGAARVYVAVKTLRDLGLASVLRREEEGYLLDPTVPLVRHRGGV